MITIDDARRAAASLLRETTGRDLPEWRPAVDESDGIPDAIAPVCADEDHERDDAGVYDCCPEPIIPMPSALVDYLVALLNADRQSGGAA